MFYTPQRNAFPDNVLLEEASYLFGEKKKTGRVGLSEGHRGRVVHTVWAQAGQSRVSFQVGEPPIKASEASGLVFTRVGGQKGHNRAYRDHLLPDMLCSGSKKAKLEPDRRRGSCLGHSVATFQVRSKLLPGRVQA